METEFKDSRLKYVEMPRVFHHKANEISISSKQHIRACEKLAKHLAGKKSKNAKEFEQDEWLKNFVIKSAELNDRTLKLLEYIAEFLTETALDSMMLIEGAKMQDQIRNQSDAILMAHNTRDLLIKELYDFKKNELRANKELTQ